MKNLFMFIFFFIIVLITGCGNKAEPVKARFKIFAGNMDIQATFPGGLILKGKNESGPEQFTTAYNPNLELILKKGVWHFAVIGWDGPLKLEGNQKCDYQVVDIQSDIFSVNFSLDRAKCSNVVGANGKYFTAPYFYNFANGNLNGFKKLTVKTCSNLMIGSCTTQTRPFSYLVGIPNFSIGVPVASGSPLMTGLKSQCITLASSEVTTPPYGGENGIFDTQIAIFESGGPAFNNPTSFSMGKEHTCATSANGLFCFGSNLENRFGDGGTSGSSVPKFISSEFNKVKAGFNHTCGKKSNNSSLWCWGNNSQGKLGDNTTINRSVPTAVLGYFASNPITDFSVGESHTCASSANYVYCWGDNSFGQLGIGNYIASSSPTLVISTSTLDLKSGANHNCAVYSGYLKCWGRNNRGQIGDNTYGEKPSPEPILSGTFGKLSLGNEHTCVEYFGSLKCWGNNDDGQLGVGDFIEKISPALVANDANNLAITPILELSAGFNHTCAIQSTTSALYCWGSNSKGQLGSNLILGNKYNIPQLIFPNGVVKVMAGNESTCAQFSDSTVKCWGKNDKGQLGNNTLVDAISPTPVITGSLPCTGDASTYFFNNGFGKKLDATIIENGTAINKKAALSIEENPTNANTALANFNLKGGVLVLPEAGTFNAFDLFYNKSGSSMTTGGDTLIPGDYFYFNGSIWKNVQNSDSVRLLIQK